MRIVSSPEEIVERIVSPVKVQPKRQFLTETGQTDSGYEPDVPGNPTTPKEFIMEFVKIRPFFSHIMSTSQKVELNGILKRLSKLESIIPGPGDFVGIKDKDVSAFKTFQQILILMLLPVEKGSQKNHHGCSFLHWKIWIKITRLLYQTAGVDQGFRQINILCLI